MNELKKRINELEAELDVKNELIQKITYERLEEERRTPTDINIIVDPSYIFDENGKFLHTRLADEIVSQLPDEYLNTPVTNKGGDIVWRYNEKKGIFEPTGIPWLQTQIKDILGDEYASRRANEVIKQIQVETYDFENSLRKETNLNLVVVKNGVLDIHTKELHPFSPKYKAKNRVPVNYNPEADCPEFKQFLREIHHKEDLDFIQEWWGYHLYRQYKFHKAVMFTGEGGNGKSTELNALCKFLGEDNVTHETLYQLSSNRFSPGKLFGKTANIAPDLAPDEIKRSSNFKALTGGDKIRGEHKFEHTFYFWNYAKLSFSCNQLPTTPDNTRAFFRRWVIVNFPNVFEGDDKDENKLEKITTPEELSGILNWALEGLQRLLKQGYFSKSRSTDEVAEEWRDKSNPVKSFMDNCLEENPDGVIQKDKMYIAYSNYCKIRGFTKEIKSQLTVKMKEERIMKEGRRTIKGYEKRQHCWLGLELRCGETEYCPRCPGCPTLHYLSSEKTGENARLNNRTLDTLDGLDTPQISEDTKDIFKTQRTL